MGIKFTSTAIDDYIFPKDSNSFAFDAKPQKTTKIIARKINDAIEKYFDNNNVLVRGIQSGKHKDIDRSELIKNISMTGSDGYSEELDGLGVIFATPYIGLITIETILSGFHEFKPKCEERPQYPVDIWMIFDKNVFNNIEYIHPGQNVKANDKWQIKNKSDNGLKGLLVIN